MHIFQREEKRQLNRKGPVVRAEIDTELLAEFSSRTDCVLQLKSLKNKMYRPLILMQKPRLNLQKSEHKSKKLEKAAQCS